MYNKIKRELYATDCECFEIKFYTADRLPCFGCQMFKKWPFKLGRMYQTARQNDGFHALRLCCSKLNPACLCYDSKPAKLYKARWAIQLLNHLLGLPNRATVTSLSKAIKCSDIHLEVLSLQNRECYEYFLCFHRTLGISPKDLEGFKADIAFIYTALACSLVILPQILTFVTWNFIGSCVVRCTFWLVSRNDDCLERELRKSFWNKKLINKISIHLSNQYWEIFYKSNRKLFFCVCIARDKHSRGWENSRQLCKLSHFYIKHGKTWKTFSIALSGTVHSLCIHLQ